MQDKAPATKTNYKGWPNCYRLANETIELIVTTDVGPRIIRFGFVGGDNEFVEFPDQLGKTGGKEWRIYGGHRFWHAPEVEPRTYFPDNDPVRLEQHDGFVRVIQPIESTTGIQKEIDIRLHPKDARVETVHRLRNCGLWDVELAPWALSVMACGGTAIVPLPSRGSHGKHLLPENSLTLWKYTNMGDPRWTWGNKFILLRQDSTPTVLPQKIGVMTSEGWAAYARDGHLFLKQFQYVAGVPYPDFGSCVEVFTNHEILEVETLGPLVTLRSGAHVEHTERWFLFRDVPVPKNDADVEKHILPKVKAAR
ncbi:MAG TPA: hypothetical protein VL171_14940 [Verrucomicrobiae bacterium]|nr:hypothetical protein [Verrucomicrobiae bacterium]